MSPRRKNFGQPLDSNDEESQQTGPSSTQLIPYSEWRVILYHRASNQVVLYNKDNGDIEVRPVVAQSLALPYAHRPTAANNLALANRRRNGSLDIRSAMGVCPTCHRPLAGQIDNMWDSHVETDTDTGAGGMLNTSDNREYFRLLEQSLRLRRTRLALGDETVGESDNTSLDSSGYTGYGHTQNMGQTDSLQMLVDEEDEAVDHMESSANTNPLAPSPGQDNSQDHGVSSVGAGSANRAPGAGLSSDSFNQGYYARFFSEQKKLGKGLRGSVFSCQHILDGVYLGHYAVKKVPVGNNHTWLKRMLREVKLLERLRHPNVVEYKHSWLEMHQLTSFGPKVPCLFILMEYANGGNLQEYMEPRQSGYDSADTSASLKHKILNMRRRKSLKGSRKLPENKRKPADGGSTSEACKRILTVEQIWSFFSDICSGLAHLHQLQIIHRDLKHMNLLLQWNDPDSNEGSGELPRIMLTDFGECEVLSHLEKRDRTGATGTLEFMAPELIEVDATGRYLDSYSTKSDMWSLGMVLYYLCYSRLPYTNIDDIDVLRQDVLKFKHVDFTKIRRPNGAEDIPLELRAMMQMLLSPDENKRPDAADVIQRVNEHKNFWLNRHHDAARFELHESDMASSHGGTPGNATPRLASADAMDAQAGDTPSAAHTAAKGREPVKRSTALVYNPNYQLVKFTNRRLLLVPSGASTPRSETSTQHDSSAQASAQPPANLEAPGECKKAAAAENNTIGSSSTIFKTNCKETSKEDKRKDSGIDGCVDTAHVRAKRPLPDDGKGSCTVAKRSCIADHEDASGLEFYTKTAVMLLKVYFVHHILHSMERQERLAAMSMYLMGLSLVFSAFDIRCNSLKLTIVLLIANMCVVYFCLQFQYLTQ
ncbi:putative serine/threonine-protein kinase iks1 [Dipsacomyces acuminosporus]|nr:putative serine/threonine-protein kinase iks1 [Dipsacomyces acuminosporus]